MPPAKRTIVAPLETPLRLHQIARVPLYTIYLHSAGQAVPSFRVVECDNDNAAAEVARSELAFSRTAHEAEVRIGDRAVLRLQRAA